MIQQRLCKRERRAGRFSVMGRFALLAFLRLFRMLAHRLHTLAYILCACIRCILRLRFAPVLRLLCVLAFFSVLCVVQCIGIVIFRENRHQGVFLAKVCNLSFQSRKPLQTPKTCVSVSQSLIKYAFALFCMFAYALNTHFSG